MNFRRDKYAFIYYYETEEVLSEQKRIKVTHEISILSAPSRDE